MKKIIKGFKSDTIELIDKNQEAQNVYTFKFTKPKQDYHAGQHFIFRLKHENKDKRGSVRVFSVTSVPSEDSLTFSTRYFGEDSSSFKKSLYKLNAGDKIKVIGPSFMMDNFKIRDYSKHQVFIVGGIGVTPLYSVLKDEYENRRGTAISIFYANKDKDFIFGDDIEKMVEELKNVNLVKTISPDKITAKQLKKAVSGDVEIAISGTPGFVENYIGVLTNELSVETAKIKNYIQKPKIGGGYEN